VNTQDVPQVDQLALSVPKRLDEKGHARIRELIVLKPERRSKLKSGIIVSDGCTLWVKRSAKLTTSRNKNLEKVLNKITVSS
jgi:hypothetical protein